MERHTGTYALVVDDDETSIVVVENILVQMGYEVRIAKNGRQALTMLKEHPTHLIITDWEMPEMSGIELCHAIRHSDYPGYIYVIMITGRSGEQQRIEGLMAGADNFITKPVKPAELLVCLKTAERVLSLETCELAIFALARLAESRDLETGAHVERVQEYAELLAEELAKNERHKGTVDADYIRLLHQTSPLHDIGKVGIPDAVLLKPGRLDEREFAVMKTHAQIGAQTLDAALERFPNAKYLRMARQIAASHHEKFDGSGYPLGLAGDQIPLCGRIVALADVYDALTTRRVYKDAITHEQARSIIVRDSGTHFDPDVVAAFLACEAGFAKIKETLADSVSPKTSILLKNIAALSAPANDKRRCILVVEDDAIQRDEISSLLLEYGYFPLIASNSAEALEILQAQRPRVIISDWAMPGMNGIDLCRRIRDFDQLEYVFFLMLTMHTDKEHMIEAFDAGVDDFVLKPVHQGELLARIRAGLRTIQLHDELNRRTHGVQQLNAQLLQLNSKLERLAVIDELTGLYNRRQAMIRLGEKVESAARYGHALSVAMLDLDHFKRINDTFGHAAGDEILRAAATVLLANVRSTDTVFRIGGEEFLIVFPAQTAQEAMVSVERCRAAIAADVVTVGDSQIPMSISAGISAFRTSIKEVSTLLKEADDALYEAKSSGRNCVRRSTRSSVEC